MTPEEGMTAWEKEEERKREDYDYEDVKKLKKLRSISGSQPSI